MKSPTRHLRPRVRVFFKDLLAKHDATLSKLGVDLNTASHLVEKIQSLPARKDAIEPIFRRLRTRSGPGLLNSTTHHQPAVPSDVIVDASMPR